MAKTITETKCPVTATLNLIGGKWKAIILYSLTNGTKRFGEIAVRIPDISRRMWTTDICDRLLIFAVHIQEHENKSLPYRM